MKVFVSWSGERSRQVGELLDDWLQCVIQAINPWRSDRDIDRGSLWFTQITSQLQETGIGIVCITQENKENPWILFESGALAKGITSNRVCTFLIDLEPSDIKDPLAQFNHTKPTYEGVKSLVRTLNSILEENSLPEKILDQVFETYWPQFEEKFKLILESTTSSEVVEKRSDDDVLSEILSITRGMNKRINELESKNKHSSRLMYDDVVFSPRRISNLKNEMIKYALKLLNEGKNFEDILNQLYKNFPEVSKEEIVFAFDRAKDISLSQPIK